MIIGCGRRVETVVPFAVPGVAGEPGLLQLPHLPVGDLHALGVSALVEPGLDFQAGAGGGRPDGADDDFVAGQGRPRQFIEMKLNSLCSIRFHLEVPGGWWHTLMARLVSAARAASSVFQSRTRLPLDPPQSAV